MDFQNTAWAALLTLGLPAVEAHAQFGAESIIARGNYGPAVKAIAPADLDGDGDADLLYAASTGATQVLAWYENDGTGRTGRQRTISTELGNMTAVAAADMDGDGDMDVVVGASYSMTGVGVCLNLGAGNWGAIETVPTSIFGATALQLGDLDLDGDVDVLITNEDAVLWASNDGTGSLGAWNTLFPYGAYEMCITDVDDDNDPDLMMTVPGPLMRGYNNGNGVFSFIPSTDTLSVYNAYRLAAADLDGDGDEDLVGETQNKLISWFNDGAANFNEYAVFDSNYFTTTFVLSDLNGDGTIDVITDKNLWYANNGSGIMSGGMAVTAQPGYFTRIVKTADFDNDGDEDLLRKIESDSLKVIWNANDGLGEFGETYFIAPDLAIPDKFSCGDLDGDGDLDMLAASPPDNKLCWYANDGTGTFGGQRPISHINSFGRLHEPVDIDGDGDLDVLASLSTGVVLFPNDGTGVLGDPQFIHPLVDDLLSADIDGDADPDLVISDQGDLSWLENDGLGGFTPHAVATAVDYPLRMADIDGDGDLDIVVEGFSGSSLQMSWYPNDGTGTFGFPETFLFNEPATTGYWTITDFDGDGFDEILRPRIYSSDTVVLLEYDGQGAFIETTLPCAIPVTQCDLDGDGDNDLLSPVRWLERVSADSVSLHVFSNENPSRFRNIGHGDLDGDGDPDMVFVRFAPTENDDLGWRENFNGGAYRIEGRTFVDENGSGGFDQGDVDLPWAQVLCSPYTLAPLTSETGHYVVTAEPGEYTVESDVDPLLWSLSTDSTVYHALLTAQDPARNDVDFGFVPAVDTSILIASIAEAPATCSALTGIWLSYTNGGTRVEHGLVSFQLDELYTFVGSDLMPDSVVGQTIWWAFDTLMYNEVHEIPLIVTTPSDAFMGDTIEHVLTVIPLDGLSQPTGSVIANSYRTVQCSYDPNEKRVSPEGTGQWGVIPLTSEYLDYTVHFQNTGTAPAANIVVVDQLVPEVDPTTVQIIGYSHIPSSVGVESGGELVMRFDNVQLPDSGTDYLGSQGFISFRIRITGGLSNYTAVTNQAVIHFDNNDPITTNTTLNTLVDCGSLTAEVAWWAPDLIGTSLPGSYQWFLNGDSIVGGQQQQLFTTEPGAYTVRVSNVYGCETTSEPYVIVSTGLLESGAFHAAILPNPVTEGARLFCSEVLTSAYSVDLVDIQGRTRRQLQGHGSREVLIGPDGMSAGLYLARISKNGELLGTVRFVVP